jgi:hypothetical protein
VEVLGQGAALLEQAALEGAGSVLFKEPPSLNTDY